MGYIKENKAVIENLFSDDIENNSVINTVYLQTGSTNITENLISNSLTTKNFKQPVTISTNGTNVQLTRDALLNNGNILYNVTSNFIATLPKMSTQDVGLVVRIGKSSGGFVLTLQASTNDFLNNIVNGNTTIGRYKDILLYKVSGGVSYWISQPA